MASTGTAYRSVSSMEPLLLASGGPMAAETVLSGERL